MAASSPVPRSHSRNSFYSTTTYHSFQDVELYEPASSSSAHATGLGLSAKDAPVRRLRPSRKEDLLDHRPSSFQMVRQDSGYESSTPPPPPSRSSHSSRRYRAASSQHASSSSSSPPRPASQTRASRAPKRPSLRRTAATTSGPISHLPARSSLAKHSYFQFPSPECLDEGAPPPQQRPPSSSQRSATRPSIDLAPVIRTVNTANENSNRSPDPSAPSSPPQAHHSSTPNNTADDDEQAPVSPYAAHAPPQTTHYWTSDRTRRLEYAAIDAASRGVRGWVMRNMVPECFVPKEKRRVAFDDDSGSVRRYRLDLEIECPEESVPPSPVGEKLRGFRARAAGQRGSWWSRLRGCT